MADNRNKLSNKRNSKRNRRKQNAYARFRKKWQYKRNRAEKPKRDEFIYRGHTVSILRRNRRYALRELAKYYRKRNIEKIHYTRELLLSDKFYIAACLHDVMTEKSLDYPRLNQVGNS